MEEIAGGPLASGYTGRSNFYNVIGHSNDCTVVVCGIGVQWQILYGLLHPPSSPKES